MFGVCRCVRPTYTRCDSTSGGTCTAFLTALEPFSLQSTVASEAMAAFGRSGSMATNDHEGSMVAINAVAAKAKAKAKSWSRAFAPVRNTGPQVDNGFPEGGMSDSARRRLVADFVEEHLEQPQWYDEFELVHGGSPAPFPEEHARVSGYGGGRSMAMGSVPDGGPSGQAPVAPAGGYRIAQGLHEHCEAPRCERIFLGSDSGRTMKWPKGRHLTRVSRATCRGSKRAMVPMVSNKFRHMDTQGTRDTISQHGCAMLHIPRNLLVDHEVSTEEQKVEMSFVRLKRGYGIQYASTMDGMACRLWGWSYG